MLIKIGTKKYHLFIEILYFYKKYRIMNIITIGITGVFAFLISSQKPYIHLLRDLGDGSCRNLFQGKRAEA